MARPGFRRTGDWAKWEQALKPGVMERAIKRRMRKATRLNGALAQRAIRQTIRNGGFTPNAPLTIHIKSSSKPLVDQGTGIFQAITSQIIDDVTVFAGVLRTEGAFNIAMALHEGAVLPVTPAMRGMFLSLWEASIGSMDPSDLTGRARELWERRPGGWAPLQLSTTRIIIPGRPFIKSAFANARLKNLAKTNWQEALRQAMRDLAQGS